VNTLLLMLGFGLLFGVLSSVPVGPFLGLLVRNVMQEGRRAAAISLAGLITAELAFLTLFQLGLDELILGTEWLRLPLTGAGALVLIAVGVQSWRQPPLAVDAAPSEPRHWFGIYREALALCVLHPGVLGLFAVLLTVAHGLFGGDAAAQWQLPMMLAYVVGVALYYGTVAWLLERLPAAMEARLRQVAGRAVAVLLWAFAAWMLGDVALTLLSAAPAPPGSG
jgi:threonine/homoserine/homoserine lactone efflux protein